MNWISDPYYEFSIDGVPLIEILHRTPVYFDSIEKEWSKEDYDTFLKARLATRKRILELKNELKQYEAYDKMFDDVLNEKYK